jgi:hypothetical protein
VQGLKEDDGGRFIALIGTLGWKGKWRRRPGAVRITAAHGRLKQRKERGVRKEGEAPTGGASMSASTEKRKKGEGGPLLEKERWVVGRLGQKVRR